MNSPVFISTSMAIIAASSIAHARDQQITIDELEITLNEEIAQQLKSAVSKREVRQAVNSVFDVMVNSFQKEGITLNEKYFKDDPLLVAQASIDSDNDSTSTVPSFSCYNNCYSNCHSACHGSRGWR